MTVDNRTEGLSGTPLYERALKNQKLGVTTKPIGRFLGALYNASRVAVPSALLAACVPASKPVEERPFEQPSASFIKACNLTETETNADVQLVGKVGDSKIGFGHNCLYVASSGTIKEIPIKSGETATFSFVWGVSLTDNKTISASELRTALAGGHTQLSLKKADGGGTKDYLFNPQTGVFESVQRDLNTNIFKLAVLENGMQPEIAKINDEQLKQILTGQLINNNQVSAVELLSLLLGEPTSAHASSKVELAAIPTDKKVNDGPVVMPPPQGPDKEPPKTNDNVEDDDLARNRRPKDETEGQPELPTKKQVENEIVFIKGNLPMYDGPNGNYLGFVILQNIEGGKVEVLRKDVLWAEVRVSLKTSRGTAVKVFWTETRALFNGKPADPEKVEKVDVLGTKPPQSEAMKNVDLWGVDREPPEATVSIYAANENTTALTLSAVVITRAYKLSESKYEIHFKVKRSNNGPAASAANCIDCVAILDANSEDRLFAIWAMGFNGYLPLASLSEVKQGMLVNLRLMFWARKDLVQADLQGALNGKFGVVVVYKDPRSNIAGSVVDSEFR